MSSSSLLGSTQITLQFYLDRNIDAAAQDVQAAIAAVQRRLPTDMPAPPSFQAAPSAAAPTGAPFSDPKGLIDYVMSAYKALGPQKGAQIQQVLTGLGYGNINDVKPEHYGQLFAGVEALKG